MPPPASDRRRGGAMHRRMLALNKVWAPTGIGAHGRRSDSRCLFERAIYRCEVAIDGAAEQIDDSDDRQSDACRDQSVFNCRCALFIRPEFSEAKLQPDLPLCSS